MLLIVSEGEKMSNQRLTIEELFKKDINRPIKGVIQAGQQETDDILEELNEYVMTEEVSDKMEEFYSNYSHSIKEPTDKMGVWISGFFGSGKSHFLKILSYLLDNREIDGQRAVEFFPEKTSNEQLLGWIQDCSQFESDALLFNIESKTSTKNSGKEKIVDVFLKVFNEHLGYSSTAWIANIERQLDDEGKYGDFKAMFADIDGKPWEEGRSKITLKQKAFTEALIKVGYNIEDGKYFLQTAKENFEISSENLAKVVAQYCKRRGKSYRIIFLVDEIGQYIGDDLGLMLNLQTVVEDLGNYAKGQAWVVVTSQEKIDAVTKVKGGDNFSKIQGRFATRLNLSSANADEVIKRRVLEKKDKVEQSLQVQYETREQSLRNTLSFDKRTSIKSGFRSSSEYKMTYPFIPYQFDLLQNVFEKIRKQGEGGKHLSHGERSLLGSFQEVAIKLKDHTTETLATFSLFYETIQRFLDTSIASTIKKASQRDELESFDIEVLKTLYLVKGIEQFPTTIENITTLFIDSVESIKNEIERKIIQSLKRLEEATLIEQRPDLTYVFLSDEEQEINQEIKSIRVDDEKITSTVAKYLFDEIYQENSYRTNTGHTFMFNRKMDDYMRGSAIHALTLQVYSGYVSEQQARMEANSGTLVMLLPETGSSYEEPFRYAEQISSYSRVKRSSNLSPAQSKVMDQKDNQLNEFYDKGKEFLREACRNASFYVQGQKETFSGDVANQIDKAFDMLIRNTYTKLSYIEERVETRQAAKMILEWAEQGISLHLDGKRRNHNALEEIERYLEDRTNAYSKQTIKTINDHFKQAPYGWNDNDISGLIALLIHGGKVKLTYNYEKFDPTHAKFVDRLTKAHEKERVVIELEVEIPAQVRNKALRVMKVFFGQVTLGETYDDVAKTIRQKATEYMSAPIKEVDNRRRSEHRDYPYPGSVMYLDLKRQVDELLSITSSEDLVHEIMEMEDDLDQWFEEMEILQSFYLKEAINLYDKAVKLLIEKKSEINTATSIHPEIQNLKGQTENILKNDAPYKQIHQLNQLSQQLEEQLIYAADQEKERLKPHFESINEEIEQLQNHYTGNTAVVDYIKSEKRELINIYGQFLASESITEILSLKEIISRLFETFKKGIKALVSKEVNEKKPKLELKQKKEVSITQMFDSFIQAEEIELDTDEEIERYLRQIKYKLMEMVKQHTLVIKK